MIIHFFHFKNQNISIFQSKILSKLELRGYNTTSHLQVIDSESTISSKHLFEYLNTDIVIIPSDNLEYPFSKLYLILAIMDSSTNQDQNCNNIFSNYAVVTKNGETDLIDTFKEDDLRNRWGKVYITGFGPGDPDLLTIKAVKAIENADVIFYDSLINQEFLEQYNVEKVYVGKRKGNHTYGQNVIDEMLYQSAISGKNTVRLKGGDPFIYGRGGEEFDYLRHRFIDVEVIPGITAAFGAASNLGISLTQRGISSSVAFCTGFPKENRRIPDADTLVFYMSASNLQDTAQLLIESGHSPETPVALIRNATLSDQESKFTTLIELSKGKASMESPMIAIIGNIAKDKHV
jgi:uroporphyrinogen III methyltransferase / synthase